MVLYNPYFEDFSSRQPPGTSILQFFLILYALFKNVTGLGDSYAANMRNRRGPFFLFVQLWDKKAKF